MSARRNAMTELMAVLAKIKVKMKCAIISMGLDMSWEEDVEKIALKLNYSDEELQQFFEKLDLTYDAGYGGQELFGTVWLEDGTWLSRGEYDGSEWWEHNVLPAIPNECLEL